MKFGRHRNPRDESTDGEHKTLPLWQETLLLVGTAVILALLLKTFFVQAFYIPSGSMRETLEINDRILVQKVSYWFGDVERGDIVVFDDPANWLGQEDAQSAGNAVTNGLARIGLYPTGGHLVKRVIGVEGDVVECRDGTVLVNDVALEEDTYVTLPNEACSGSWKTPEIPDDRIWVMGDNRNQSADSRVHIGEPGGGFIPVDDVVGKVFVIVWPPDRWDIIGRPDSFDALNEAGAVSVLVPAGLALSIGVPLYRRRRDARDDDG